MSAVPLADLSDSAKHAVDLRRTDLRQPTEQDHASRGAPEERSINRGQENRRSTRLESDAGRAQVRKLSVGGEVQQFDRLRQQQQRRRCKQHRAGHRHHGADCAGVLRMLIGTVVGCGMLLIGLKRGSGLRRNPMEMTERKRKLDRQRQERYFRNMFDVRSKPLHAAKRLAPGSQIMAMTDVIL